MKQFRDVVDGLIFAVQESVVLEVGGSGRSEITPGNEFALYAFLPRNFKFIKEPERQFLGMREFGGSIWRTVQHIAGV